MRALKVYGGAFDGTYRYIVAARSQKAACEALNVAGLPLSLYAFREYGRETGNDTEIELAMRAPGAVFRTDAHQREYYPYPPVKGEG